MRGAADWAEFAPGSDDRAAPSLPVGYELVGRLLAPLVRGQPLRLHRTCRNGLSVDGEFISSAVQEIGSGWVRTENSLYAFATHAR